MLVAALPLAGAALAPAVPGVGAWHAARSLAYLRSSTITAQAPKQASGAAAEAEGTRDAEGAYDPSTWAPPRAADQVDAPSICSLVPDPSTKTKCCCPAKPKADSNTNSRPRRSHTPIPVRTRTPTRTLTLTLTSSLTTTGRISKGCPPRRVRTSRRIRRTL